MDQINAPLHFALKEYLRLELWSDAVFSYPRFLVKCNMSRFPVVSNEDGGWMEVGNNRYSG